MSAPELSRPIELAQCDARDFEVVASPDECAALAERFELVRIDWLMAALQLARNGDAVAVQGKLEAHFVQTCAVSAEDLPVSVKVPLSLRFSPAAPETTGEIELEINSGDSDEIEYTGSSIDLGEAVAQSFALTIDPFATGPDADAARKRLRSESTSPFAALAALKTTSDKGTSG